MHTIEVEHRLGYVIKGLCCMVSFGRQPGGGVPFRCVTVVGDAEVVANASSALPQKELGHNVPGVARTVEAAAMAIIVHDADKMSDILQTAPHFVAQVLNDNLAMLRLITHYRGWPLPARFVFGSWGPIKFDFVTRVVEALSCAGG